MKRSDAIRFHSEEAASCNSAAASASGPARSQLRELAADHQAHADMARHGEYPEDLED
ncbi:hypothetical protein ACIP8U_00530 [Streptomyces pseudovenezuelae]|uniref:hypothetical protein n=1 Tax=Streptomyces pseudovenezuelae TaxID=67350 RepID=UPI003811E738